MYFGIKKNFVSVILFASITVLAIGCAQQSSDTQPSDSSANSQEGHDHGGWWCDEHGIPEENCSMCSKKAADEFKEKGDWCDEHNRAESQCFQCDPTRADKFAKLYEAKYGEQPPAATE